MKPLTAPDYPDNVHPDMPLRFPALDATRSPAIKTPAMARAELRKRGITITKWARDNNFPRAVVGDLLLGRVAGNYGKAHEAAVKLGLKEAV